MEVEDWKTPKESGLYREYCKTAFRPYDLAVNAFLVIAKHYLGENLKVGSDGKVEHWIDAVQICQNAFGYGLEDFKLD